MVDCIYIAPVDRFVINHHLHHSKEFHITKITQRLETLNVNVNENVIQVSYFKNEKGYGTHTYTTLFLKQQNRLTIYTGANSLGLHILKTDAIQTAMSSIYSISCLHKLISQFLEHILHKLYFVFYSHTYLLVSTTPANKNILPYECSEMFERYSQVRP